MTSQCAVVPSPDGRFLATTVHQYLSLVDAHTGTAVALPAPEFTAAENAADDGSDDSDVDGSGDEAEGAEEESDQPKKKKTKVTQKASVATRGKGQRSHDGPKPIRVVAFHPNNQWFMYSSDEKYVHLYHIDTAAYAPSGFKHIHTVTIPRKVQAAAFHTTAFSPSTTHFQPTAPDTPLRLPHLLVADKTGDVFTVSGVDLSEQKCELGHLANITGLEFFTEHGAERHGTKPKSYLLSSDSDAKIRVSNVPHYFDIQSFCLGHAAFVSAFSVIPATPAPVILSGGLGSELILWQLDNGAEMSRFDLAAHKPAAAEAASAAAAAPSAPSAASTEKDCYVSQISHVRSTLDTHTLLVTVYPWACVFLLTYTGSTRELAVTTTVRLDATPMYARVLTPDRMMLIDESLRVRTWNYAGGAELLTGAPLETTLATLNAAFAAPQAAKPNLLIDASNAEEFIGSGTSAAKNAPQTEAQKARAAAAAASGFTGRYISPFSSLHADHLHRLALLSPPGFTFRRYADKMTREAYIQQKKAEAAAKKEQQRLEKQKKKEANQRKRQDENDMDE